MVVYLCFVSLADTIKKCPHMLKSDHRELINRKVKLMWVGFSGVSSGVVGGTYNVMCY